MGGGFMAGTLVACHRNMLMVCPLRCRELLFALCSPLVGVWGVFGGLGIFL